MCRFRHRTIPFFLGLSIKSKWVAWSSTCKLYNSLYLGKCSAYRWKQHWYTSGLLGRNRRNGEVYCSRVNPLKMPVHFYPYPGIPEDRDPSCYCKVVGQGSALRKGTFTFAVLSHLNFFYSFSINNRCSWLGWIVLVWLFQHAQRWQEKFYSSGCSRKQINPERPDHLLGNLQFVKLSSIAWSANHDMQAKPSPPFISVRPTSLEWSFLFCNDFFYQKKTD